jgi:hypothetical protein
MEFLLHDAWSIVSPMSSHHAPQSTCIEATLCWNRKYNPVATPERPLLAVTMRRQSLLCRFYRT